jgi:hypothetical protein
MSGGHSFSSADIEAVRNASQPVVVNLISAKTTLVPAELFDKEHAIDYLHDVGLYPAHNEFVVYSKENEGIVAVMAINAECYKQLQEAATHGLSFIMPLMEEYEEMYKGCAIHLEGDVLYVYINDNGLRFAEVMECTTDADVLYYLSVVNEAYNIYNMHARAKGDVARLKRVCKGLFKELLCE